MDIVNIVVDVPEEHLASIYALILSIITNKYEESIYYIFLDDRCDSASRLEPLLSLQSDKVKIILCSAEKPETFPEDAIFLRWNMIVTGDLTEISDPEQIGCEDNPDYGNMFSRDSRILRCDPGYSPEEYFDHPLAGQWLGYYKASPMKDVPLRRCSYVETQGEISVQDSGSAVPIAIYTCDWDIPSAVALLYSIRTNTSTDTQLDIRIFYRNLSQKHADILLSFCDENISIILYNVKRCTDAEFHNTRLIPSLLAFDEYTKVIYMDSECLCLDDIRDLYQSVIEPYEIRAAGYIPDTGDMPGMMLLNAGTFIKNDFCVRYTALNRIYGQFQELVYMVSGKRIDCMKSFSICSFKDEDNPWKCPDEKVTQLLWDYLSLSPQFEQLKTEALTYEQQREVADMQELLKQVKDLQIENDRLAQKVQSLEEDNTSLRSERDQFLYELLETRKSFTYRIGRVITFIPRKMRGERKPAE